MWRRTYRTSRPPRRYPARAPDRPPWRYTVPSRWSATAICDPPVGDDSAAIIRPVPETQPSTAVRSGRRLSEPHVPIQFAGKRFGHTGVALLEGAPDDASPIVLRDAWPILRGRRCSLRHGARADPGCFELSLAQDPACVGSRGVPARTLGDASRT